VTEASLGIEDGVVTIRLDADLRETLIGDVGINDRLITHTDTPSQLEEIDTLTSFLASQRSTHTVDTLEAGIFNTYGG
jgi:hypothetical protein